MSNAIAVLDLSQLPSTSVGAVETFDNLAKGANFLGRLQLFGSNSKQCQKGLIKPGHFGIPVSDDEVVDLGATCDVLPLARRPKAIDMSDSPVVTCYNENDPTFVEIADRSKVQNSKCQFGPSFLVVERSTGRLLEYFLGSPTHRPEAKNIYPKLPLTQGEIDARKLKEEPRQARPITLKSKYIEKEFSWYVPVVLDCSTPFTALPPMAEIVTEIQKFLTEKGGAEEDGDEPKSTAKKSSRKR